MEIFIFSVQLTTSRFDNLTRLIHALAICDDHIYIVFIVGRQPTVQYKEKRRRTLQLALRAILYGNTSSKSVDQPGKVASPARGQLNRKNEYFPIRVRP